MGRIARCGVIDHDPRGPDPKRSRDQAGFTLVEVMVVVLIVGILLSIGVPTFVGARNRAHDIAARSNLDLAMETAMVIALSDPGADFTAATAAALNDAEPSLLFLSETQQSSGPNEISIDAAAADRWTATVRSSSGSCLGVEVTPLGSSTFESSSCTANLAADVNMPFNIAPSSAVSQSSDWRSPGYEAANLVDGSTATFNHTDWVNGQSVAFDLARVTSIIEISMWNRADCCGSRMKNMYIFVSDSPISTDLTTARNSGAATFHLPGQVGFPSTIPINAEAQYVRIFATGPVVHLGEIEILALP